MEDSSLWHLGAGQIDLHLKACRSPNGDHFLMMSYVGLYSVGLFLGRDKIVALLAPGAGFSGCRSRIHSHKKYKASLVVTRTKLISKREKLERRHIKPLDLADMGIVIY